MFRFGAMLREKGKAAVNGPIYFRCREVKRARAFVLAAGSGPRRCSECSASSKERGEREVRARVRPAAQGQD